MHALTKNYILHGRCIVSITISNPSLRIQIALSSFTFGWEENGLVNALCSANSLFGDFMHGF